MISGIHIIAKLSKCKCNSQLFSNITPLISFIKKEIEIVGLTEIGHTNVETETKVSIVSILTESHESIHIMKATNEVLVDVFVCNITHDNTSKARNLFADICNYFRPFNIDKQEIER